MPKAPSSRFKNFFDTYSAQKAYLTLLLLEIHGHEPRDVPKTWTSRHGGRVMNDKGHWTTLHDSTTPAKACGTYPPRIPIPQSDSFRALNEVLAEADDPDSDNVSEEEDYEGNVSSTWTNELLEEVSQALIDIVNAHGLGPEGWQAARWRVYDALNIACDEQWSASIGGIDIPRRGQPVDYAWFWLSGRLPESEFHSLPFNNRFDAETRWRQYNSMLPPRGSLV
ncbi:hypothetical protein DFP72DRAFT_1069999 [Ephemerocybe angulata]|uniref:Uncharacterized protein n=1 Tax=Ephemerocybe angulata TaxID=980116 RepID=A0A8H6HU12_9AGAR|nr:hypothetical protein DFP72DRAFT_1069999 [Tulosesus angulatus]